jgi:hypothetical protein
MSRDSAAANLSRIHQLRTAIEGIRQQTAEMEQELEPLDAWRDKALDQISQFIAAQAESSSISESSCYSEEDDYSYSLTSDDGDFRPGQQRKHRFPDDEQVKRPRGRRPKVLGEVPPAPRPARPKAPRVAHPLPSMPMAPPAGAPGIITQLQLLYRFNPQIAPRLFEPYFEAYRRSQQLQTPPNQPRPQPAGPAPGSAIPPVGAQRPIASWSMPSAAPSNPTTAVPGVPAPGATAPAGDSQRNAQEPQQRH